MNFSEAKGFVLRTPELFSKASICLESIKRSFAKHQLIVELRIVAFLLDILSYNSVTISVLNSFERISSPILIMSWFKHTNKTVIRLIWFIFLGNPNFFSILSAVNARMGSISLVHIEDICNAHIFLMENVRAEGRYICSAQSCHMPELISSTARAYPSSHIKRYVGTWR